MEVCRLSLRKRTPFRGAKGVYNDVIEYNAAHCLAQHGLLMKSLIVVALLTLSLSPAFAADKATSTSARAKKPAASNAVAGPRDYTSRNFLLHTDLPPAEAKELLGRLETMLGLVSRYFGKPNSQTIELYVVKDLSAWPDGVFPPPALDSISSGAGLTMSQSRIAVNTVTGRKTAHLGTKAVVYAIADRGTPQHEAVHAYCSQMFGTTGPTWFAEGMAELGHYWRENDTSVELPREVLRYLQTSEPEGLLNIVDLRQRTGDSWQNYAWRWALCHLLHANPNYSQRFRPLGLALLTEQNATFEGVYGPMAQEISFEYLFFLKHIDNGFRADLCRWDWKTKATPVRGGGSVQAKIDAGRGWQHSRLLANEGQSYEITPTGEWSITKGGEKVTAAGDSTGKGKLVGVLFDDYKLSEPFDIGDAGRWTAPQDGTLFLRCQDDWNAIADNTGSLTVKIKAAETEH